jgi:hypothetical protein
VSRDEAVRAAAEALHAQRHPDCTAGHHAPYYRPEATVAVDAATPHIRAQAAAEVLAMRDVIHAEYERGLFRYGDAIEPGSRDPFAEVAMDALDRTAARIVEGP